MKSSEFVARYVEARGVTHAFELVGGMITHLLDSMSRHTQIRIVSCHHEQGAGFAAEGFARVSGVPGLALATSGPGATNLLTAIGSCYFDSTPAIFITGQVNTHERKGDSGVRQLGFQETDIVPMAAPIAKWAVQVEAASDLPQILEQAFHRAMSGRQGPCLVDIPMNVQAEAIDEALVARYLIPATALFREALPSALANMALEARLRQLLTAIKTAQQPLLLMGGGCASVQNRDAAASFSHCLGIPAVLSLMGVDVLPENDNNRVGFIGSYGNRWANKILGEADFLVVAGSRLDIRQTGSDLASFCAGKQIWQLDIDSAELGLRVQPDHVICAGIREGATALSQLCASEPSLSLSSDEQSSWRLRIADLRAQFPAALEYQSEPGEINPVALLQQLSSASHGEPRLYVTDVGQHQMWAAQSLAFQPGDRFLTSGGMGAMGFGLPAAIGAAMACPDRYTVLITGDGSFQVNIQEMETLHRNLLNLKIILFNNNCHGMVRQFQESYFNGNLQSTATGYSAPNFVAVATAYGISAAWLAGPAATNEALTRMFAEPGPYLLEVALSPSSKVYPKLAFGRRFGEMEPEATPLAMEST